MVWLWVLGGATVWLLLGVLIALTVGRGARVADGRSPHVGLPDGLNTAAPPVGFRSPARERGGGGPVPLPPAGIALVLVALGLETAGYLTRLSGAGGAVGSALS